MFSCVLLKREQVTGVCKLDVKSCNAIMMALSLRRHTSRSALVGFDEGWVGVDQACSVGLEFFFGSGGSQVAFNLSDAFKFECVGFLRESGEGTCCGTRRESESGS